MDFARLKAGEWIIAASAVVLGVSLFLPWYELPEMYFNRSQGVSPDDLNLDISGWEVLSIIDILLMALVVFAVLVVLRAATRRSASDGLFGEGLLAPAALVMSIVVLVRVLNMPGDLEPLAPVVDRGIGAWLGLFSTIGLLVGALVGMRNEWVGSRPVPEIETIPAPPPAGDAGG